MSLSSSTLSAIQKAGSAAFAADEKLKAAVKEYADRVSVAMLSNPYGLGNDVLFENWKVVARLSQTIAGIEDEFKKVYLVASELINDDQPTVLDVPVRVVPTRAAKKNVSIPEELAAADVKIKTKKKLAVVKTPTPKVKTKAPAKVKAPVKVKTTAKVKAPAKASAPKRASASGAAVTLSGNPSKLFQHFEGLLNTSDFNPINQSAIGLATGIPLGSMTAAIKKLIDLGRILVGPKGGYKLANAPQALTL